MAYLLFGMTEWFLGSSCTFLSLDLELAIHQGRPVSLKKTAFRDHNWGTMFDFHLNYVQS